MFLAIQGAHHRLADSLFQQALDFFDDRADDHARRLLGALGNAALQGHERAHKLWAGFNILQHFRLEQELRQTSFLDGIVLDDSDDVFLKIAANISQPFGEVWG